MNQQYPSLEQFRAHLVTVMGGPVEVIWQPLYDYLLYPTAGSAAPFKFFSVPEGQGISSSSANAANPKGLADTNMKLAGALGQPEAFWIESIEFDVQPGSVSTANTYTVQIPAAFAAANAAAVQAGAHDVNAVLSGGFLQLNVSNKQYYQEGPLLRFPPTKGFVFDVALGTTSATAGEVVKEKLRAGGSTCVINPGIAIMAQQPFNVSVTYPTAIATPSGFNARIGVILNGYLLRPLQ